LLHPELKVFRELAVRTVKPAAQVVEEMAAKGFLAGIAVSALTGGSDPSLSDDVLGHVLLVSVTERRTAEEIDAFATALEEVAK
jgi:glycine cleavage system pyridoxal-binding protein P